MKLSRTIYHVDSYILHDDGMFPNNAALPVLHYKAVLKIPFLFAAMSIRKHFAMNGWTNCWKGAMYDFHHYHSCSHEVLGAFHGEAEILLGGDNGTTVWFEAGDVLVIPAGVAHKRIDPKAKLRCVGAYPEGRDYDMQIGAKNERPGTDNAIQLVPAPKKDPVFGADGHLMFQWKGYRKTA